MESNTENNDEVVEYDYTKSTSPSNSEKKDSTISKNEKNSNKKDKLHNGFSPITLSRLKIVKINYFFLAVFVLAGYIASRAFYIYSDAYYQNFLEYQIEGIPSILLFISSLLFMAFSMSSAHLHSKNYNSNLISVFEYMKRKNKTKFSYTLLKGIDSEQRSSVMLQRLEDNGKMGELKIIVKPIPNIFEQKKYVFEKEKSLKISEIKEIVISNQSDDLKGDPVYLEKNEKIKKMLASDRQQMLAFVSSYVFAFVAGFFLFNGLMFILP